MPGKPHIEETTADELHGRFAQNLFSRQSLRAGQVGNVAYGVIYNFDRESNFDYMCGVQVAGSHVLPNGMTTLPVAGQKYVVFTHRGHIAGIRSTIAAIWNKWFPESGFRAVEAPTLERYGPEFNPRTGMGGVEIWIPVEA
jgi:AraC family transcriptional regulator